MELHAVREIDWPRPDGSPTGFTGEAFSVLLGEDSGTGNIEVLVADWKDRGDCPLNAVKKLHSLRKRNRAADVVVVVKYPDGTVSIFGPSDSRPPTKRLDGGRAQRILQDVLNESSQRSARRRLESIFESLESTDDPGLNNSGLFATHELRFGVPKREDWEKSCARSGTLVTLRGEQLLKAMGYTVERSGAHAVVLADTSGSQAAAILLEESESFDAISDRFAVSPVSYGLRIAKQSGVDWLILSRGGKLRLYPAKVNLGVGRKGMAETFLELDLAHLDDENVGYLSLLFAPEALGEGGTTYEILESSSQYSVALGGRLREKVYNEIIPKLSVAVGEQLAAQGRRMDADGLDLAYQVTLKIFFRMLFQAYAEDRGLLPYRENQRYTRNAINTMADDLAKNPDEEFDDESWTLWDDLAQVWSVIDTGDKAWGVPAYNGGLFTRDEETNPQGALIASIRIPNSVIGPALKALLLDEADEVGLGVVDFRSLSVREFGTIYEGLLESSLGVAEVDLTLDKDGVWVPAKDGDAVEAPADSIYFHNTSGARKSTGSYFTPLFIVEHLLERSLDPALDAHLEKVAELIRAGDDAGAAELLFDFKVVDLAMGSGHFLTAAIDHIEAKFAEFLADEQNMIPRITNELNQLARAAKDATPQESYEPEPSSLLRRQIARRCIYGLDINPIAVELARVSIWIHTFVKGLPMSSLDHNLVCANSLTGIGSIEEALDVLVPGREGQATLFDQPIEDALNASRDMLIDAHRSLELHKNETRAVSKTVQRARQEAEKAKLLFDAAVLLRLGHKDVIGGFTPEEYTEKAASEQAREILKPLNPAHMPALFPEVFLREDGGFDVFLGNPPWEEVTLEELQYWTRRNPGLKGMKNKEQQEKIASLKNENPSARQDFEEEKKSVETLRAALTSGAYPGMGTGDPDLYKAFLWRYEMLSRESSQTGVVLPRSAFVSLGSAPWRSKVFPNHKFEIFLCKNKKEWLFSVNPGYSICATVIKPLEKKAEIEVWGTFNSFEDFMTEKKNRGALIDVAILTKSDENLCVPSLESPEGVELWQQMLSHPLFGDPNRKDFIAKPVREIDASLGKHLFTNNPEDHPIYNHLNVGHFKFEKEKGAFNWGNFQTISSELQKTRQSSARKARSPFLGMPPKWEDDEETLPCKNPRIAFRLVVHSTNHRKIWFAVAPKNTILTSNAPFLSFWKGDIRKEAYVLGLMNSSVVDWFGHLRINLSFNFFILNSIPLPEMKKGQAVNKFVELSAGLALGPNKDFGDWKKMAKPIMGEQERKDAVCEIDALASLFYGIENKHLPIIFNSGTRSPLEDVISFRKKWSKEL